MRTTIFVATACLAATLAACGPSRQERAPDATAAASAPAQEPAAPSTPSLGVTLVGDGWTGAAIPPGQQCNLDGGDGATPPIRVVGLPPGTAEVLVAYNDLDYEPLSTDGGHGVIAYSARPGEMVLQPVRGMTSRMPRGVRVASPAKSTGRYASPGYLPPCSGGAGHRYVAEVTAVDAAGNVLAMAELPIGVY